MTWKGAVFVIVLLLGVAAFVWGPQDLMGPGGGPDGPPAHGEEKAEAEFERGPHKGRMLRDGSFALEITIFETGVPPEFHLYAYDDGKPIKPADVTTTIELHRLDGEVNKLGFAPQEDYLKSDASVVEPHSFDVVVSASYKGSDHHWKFNSYEGRTAILEAAAGVSGLKTEIAGPVVLEQTLVLTGSVVLNQNKTAFVKARFPGIVRSVSKNVGETVAAGEVLAVIESNTSLLPYDVKAPFAGVVLERNTNLGDVTGDTSPLFVVADLSSVWAEFHVFPRDFELVKAGQTVRVKNVHGAGEAESTITIFTPVAELTSQTVIARATLNNQAGQWRPGMTVRGEVVVAKHEVPLAVKLSGLQRFRDFTVVFAKIGSTYEVRMLELGERDGTWVEVKEGLKPGTAYVTDNSFLVKADIEKSGASHDH
jgi:cobalt-zinc-cadmium efflux system membrane fusion protein